MGKNAIIVGGGVCGIFSAYILSEKNIMYT